MNLLHELKPYNSELDVWKSTGRIPHNLQPLIIVYQKLWKVRPDIGGYNVKTNCASCVGDMVKALYNCREEERKKAGKYTDFQGVPQIKKITPTEVISLNNVEEDYNFDVMSVEELKAECKKRGIKYHHKAGRKKLTELLSQ